ncbi:ThiamineS/Molybdopterin converting factor subunit 1 [Acididesulfobacillus acetoxydans]|uniref:Molybdopterin synthase/thiamin biosynthesis sulphur carrier, beta-grasp n=1 Tax=Acididesulfobacillus acetoxydans TaxID=1561005 RepID=A0A8S0WXK3_9FIRM|nr:sulfur carrier protein ThiS [Acididesulfobacillus acetoxydans]CAA7601011.1 ThiamineS/Molybdopterin converting factor subunit 1 [Acididesulfobacillus acetoxydans]CEJ06885.1 Molybdopterin synthase/thiamin biosynthesis sulphur carrier, beta-grasp [Acididesulfobacillus acetoxydans]
MFILVNGEKTEAGAGTPMGVWLKEQGIDFKAVVIEYNGRILPEEEWGEVFLQEGDRLELLQFVGGG